MKRFNHLGEPDRVPLDLKSTINLPKTDFPMKANLPQNEPKVLARWNDMRIYDRIREATPRRPYVHPARRATLRQRADPSWARPEQVPEGLHREVANHVGIRLALRARMGLPWSADRNQGRPATGRKKVADGPEGRARWNAASTRKSSSICSVSSSSGSGCLGVSMIPTPQ